MKRSAALFLLLILFSAAHAQFRAGISGCGVSTDVQGADFVDYDNDFFKIGVAGGLILNISNPEDRNSFQFEINYIQKGSMQRPDSANFGYYRLILDYIEVPLVFRRHLKFTLNKKERNRFELEFGLSVAKTVRYKQEYNGYSQPFPDNQVNRFEASILLGLNFLISDHLYAGFRYSNSVIPALKRNQIPYGYFLMAFNNGNNMVFQLGLHYVFGNPAKKTETTDGPEDGQ